MFLLGVKSRGGTRAPLSSTEVVFNPFTTGFRSFHAKTPGGAAKHCSQHSKNSHSSALKQHRAAIDFSIDMKVLRCCDYVIQRHPHEFEAGDLGRFSAGVRANTKMLKPAC